MTDETHNILRGTFSVINNRVHVTAPQVTATHELAKLHQAMVLEVSSIIAPKLPLNPEPEDFENVADYLIRFAQAVDRHVKAVGEEAKANASTKINLHYFEEQLEMALNGWATAELDKAANALREQCGDDIDEERWLNSTAPGA